jgi:hypothetical protein
MPAKRPVRRRRSSACSRPARWATVRGAKRSAASFREASAKKTLTSPSIQEVASQIRKRDSTVSASQRW